MNGLSVRPSPTLMTRILLAAGIVAAIGTLVVHHVAATDAPRTSDKQVTRPDGRGSPKKRSRVQASVRGASKVADGDEVSSHLRPHERVALRHFISSVMHAIVAIFLRLLGMGDLLTSSAGEQVELENGAGGAVEDAAGPADGGDDEEEDDGEMDEDGVEQENGSSPAGHTCEVNASRDSRSELTAASGVAQPARSGPATTPGAKAGGRLSTLLSEGADDAAVGGGECGDDPLEDVGLSTKFATAMRQRMSSSGHLDVDLSSPWARTLLKQLSQLRGKDRDPLIRVQPPSNLAEWIVEITGAPGSIYDGEKYKLQFNFDKTYPKTPPRVRFLRPPPKHEHIYSDGKICLNILYSDWKEEMTVLGVSQSLISMMASATEKKRPPDNAATIMSSIHQDPTKMQWLFHDDHC